MSVASELPAITVLVCTRNRGARIAATVANILCNDYPSFDVLVFDQSRDTLTEEAMQAFMSSPQVRYLRSDTRGLGAGHNAAIALIETELIAITDDDCLVPDDWLRELAVAFSTHERIAMIFGNVTAAPYDSSTGYIPVFERQHSLLLTSIRGDLEQGLGIGGCCALRRSAWEAVHGFDPSLGPGATRGSLEDRDVAIRLLLAGYYVYQTPRVQVEHHGFRRNQDLRALAFRDWFGFGTCYAKYLKCGHWSLTSYMVRQMWVGQALGHSLTWLRTRYRIGRVTPIVTFWLGFVIGLATKVDRHAIQFHPRSRERWGTSMYTAPCASELKHEQGT